jgi:uncharacterized protein YggL (DUF469 family)
MSAPCPVFGFVVELEMSEAPGSDETRYVRQAFLAQVAEARGLVIDERRRDHRWTFLVRSEASQATDADRRAVETWAHEQGEIVAISIGPLLDFASAA